MKLFFFMILGSSDCNDQNVHIDVSKLNQPHLFFKISPLSPNIQNSRLLIGYNCKWSHRNRWEKSYKLKETIEKIFPSHFPQHSVHQAGIWASPYTWRWERLVTDQKLPSFRGWPFRGIAPYSRSISIQRMNFSQ